MSEDSPKTIIVTGANSGIGKEAAIILAQAGHRVLMLSRGSAKSTAAQTEIKLVTSSDQVILFPVDLAEPAEIKRVATAIVEQYPVIDVLVNNAGVFNTKREVNSAGVEVNFAVNFLAPYLLTTLLLENLAASGHGRIVNVVSEIYKQGQINFDDLMFQRGYKAMPAYANSKLACVLWTKELVSRLGDKRITVNALHPGVLATDVFRDYPRIIARLLNLFLENPQKGGERIVFLATASEVANVSGAYFMKRKLQEIVSADDNPGTREKLIQAAASMV